VVKTNYPTYDVWLDGKRPFTWDDPRFQVKEK
jgi:hypothetical protein